jgi:putative oxidoreductase|tara:strand:+ start:1360 stop:1878 length:519 start_codon:yes stop_codon:yes gene_type:complete
LTHFVVIRAILTRPIAGDLGLLLLRVFTGALLIHHGYEKLANIENFADAFVRPLHLPFPILLSYVAAFSEVIGSWLLITGLLTRMGALAVAGTISVAIYHAIVTAGFNIYLLELLGLYFAAAVAVLACGPGVFSIDELIARRLEPDMQFSAAEDTDYAGGEASVLEEAVASR